MSGWVSPFPLPADALDAKWHFIYFLSLSLIMPGDAMQRTVTSCWQRLFCRLSGNFFGGFLVLQHCGKGSTDIQRSYVEEWCVFIVFSETKVLPRGNISYDPRCCSCICLGQNHLQAVRNFQVEVVQSREKVFRENIAFSFYLTYMYGLQSTKVLWPQPITCTAVLHICPSECHI